MPPGGFVMDSNPEWSVETLGFASQRPFHHAKVAPISLQRPKAVQILLPVWGHGFVRSLLQFCIPTLLAPGNVPLLAKMLPTRFVVLTRSKDRRLIETHSSWRKLAEVCDVEIRAIDDMITRDNHTACISLAFHRAILDGGACGDGTCFFLMNADFLVADGSLTNIARRMMRDGTNAVLAGNFQIVAEDAAPQLEPLVDRKSGALVMSPRDLLAFSFARLHPATIANTVNLGVTHNERPNRLFWRADGNTLLGRFFLAHVVAVMPERKPTTIGSSYDYSFIPEMCPSGNVDLITDSDDYLVVEMQPREHESREINLGPITPKRLARGLSEWTTEQHRSNAKRTVFFHAGDVPRSSPVLAAINCFMNETSTYLSTEPMPYRGHPYWLGSMSAHHERIGRPNGQSDWIDTSPHSVRDQLDALLKAAIRRVYGTRPEVTPLHPSWSRYSTISNHLKSIAPGSAGLFVCDNPTAFK